MDARRMVVVTVATLVAATMLVGCTTIGTLWAAYGPVDADMPTATSTGDAVTRVELAVGDCVDRAALEDGKGATDPVVDCSKPHDLEIYAEESIADGDYPPVDTLTALGQSTCRVAFADFVGLDFGLSHLDYLYYYPTESSWARGDRGLDCAVFDPTKQVTGSLKNAAR